MSDAGISERLRARWLADLTAVGASEDGALFYGIARSYGEAHRAYHTLDHLDFLFARLDEHAGDAGDKTRLAFAGWYHDVIYDPAARDNEERSAVRAVEEMTKLGAPASLVERVASLIRATATHTEGGADRDDNLFLDADFCILGASLETYRRYAAGVRREYVHVDDAGWRAGRGAFLKNAVARARTFHTDRFEGAYGAQARSNMAAELAALTEAE